MIQTDNTILAVAQALITLRDENKALKAALRDISTIGFDGIRRTALGELTFEFKNAKQRCCRIRGLKASAAALAEIRRSL